MKLGLLLVLAMLWTRLALAGVLWLGPDGTLPQLSKHDVIFLGELIEIEYKKNECEGAKGCRFEYKFRVLQVYKGKVDNPVVLSLSQLRSPIGVDIRSERGTYLMYADFQDSINGRRLVFDRTRNSPSFVYTRISIKDWGEALPSFDDLRIFWQSNLGRWLHIPSTKVNEPSNLVDASRDEVLRVVVLHRVELKPCYGDNLRNLKSGPVSIQYKISKEGRVIDAQPVIIKGSSEAQETEHCLLEVTKRWSFPHNSKKEAMFNLVFE